ncbi:unnamed protein product [Auanema sp. JU1783]|nr:unnamed protein product [Auanema sp. JU1783]
MPKKQKKQQAIELPTPTADDISSIHSRVRFFDEPFAHHVNNPRVEDFCSHCMRAPEPNEKLKKCAACQFAQYCKKECQAEAWMMHKHECRRLKNVFPNLPLTEVLFLSKIIDRVVFLKEVGDKFNWERDRKYADLMDHKEDILADKEKMEHFEKIYTKMTNFRKEEMVDRELMFEVFCKATINSHSIHTNAGTEVGMALDLGVSIYNHSCRPTCSMVFDGFRICLRPLVPGIDASNPEQAFISYIDVGRSKYTRRKDLKTRWYFHCECTRCTDPEDDTLTSIKCTSKDCDAPLITGEESEPIAIKCGACGKITEKDYVKSAQELMRSLPASFDPECPPDTIKDLLARAELVLHPSNVYVARLRTALFHVTGQLTLANLNQMHKQVYENYKLCFPKADRHMGYQLIHIVKTLIEQGKRQEAMPYAYDAMNIFEVCFGLDHPYYLQTLCLWTFLEKDIPKTDEELINLTHFSDNRPVDIVQLLDRANLLPNMEKLSIAGQ